MAELMKLLEAKDAFKSDLVQNYLSAKISSLSVAPVQTSSLAPRDLNLNITTSTLTSQGLVTNPSDITTSARSLTEVTPENNNFGDNLNANTVCVPSSQITNANLQNPRITSLDNMTTSPQTNLNELNRLNLPSAGSRTNGNININNYNTININVGVAADTTTENLNATQQQGKKTEPAGARAHVPDTNANNTIDITQIMSEVREGLTDSRQQLLEHVTAAIVEAHVGTTINTFANVAAAKKRIEREAADMPDTSSTNLWQHFMGAMLPEITKVIKFCTKLPGFAEISQEDLVKLIKQGCFEVMVARFCILIDHVKEEMLDPTLQVKASRSLVQSMPMGPFLDQFFTVANQFNPLGFTDGEIGLFTAILIMSPEHQGLKNQGAVADLQKLFIQSLYFLLKQSHQDAEQTLTSALNLLPAFHKINEAHLKFLKMIKMKSPGDYEKKFPALHKELFDAC